VESPGNCMGRVSVSTMQDYDSLRVAVTIWSLVNTHTHRHTKRERKRKRKRDRQTHKQLLTSYSIS